jgi:hypothetical protein
MPIIFSWAVMVCGLADAHQIFGEIRHLQLQDRVITFISKAQVNPYDVNNMFLLTAYKTT